MTPTERRIIAAFLLIAGPVAWRATEWRTWTREYRYQAQTWGAEARIMATDTRRARELHDLARCATQLVYTMPAPFLGKSARSASTRKGRRRATPDGLRRKGVV